MKKDGQTRAILLGAIFGALSGVVVTLLYRRYGRRRGSGETRPIQTGQVVRIGVAAVSLVRQFLELLS
jgi:hypothetical protein